MFRCARFALIPLLLLTFSCSRNPQAESQRLVANGNKFYNRAKYKEASIMYRRALAKDAKNGDAYYRLGLTSLKLQSWSDASRALRRAVDLQPNNADAAAKLADLYWIGYVVNQKENKNLVPEIEELSNALLKRDPKSFDGLRLAGYLELDKKHVDKALELFKKANEAKPYDPQLCLVYANTLFFNKQPEAAEKLAKEVIDKNKTFAPMYDMLTSAYMASNRYADAEKVLQQKVRNNPGQETARIQLAMFYYASKRVPDMEKVLQDMLADTKDYPYGHLSVGNFFERLRDYDRARREFDAGMAAQPKEKARYQKALVELLATQGNVTEAMMVVNDVLKADPKDAVALQLRSALALRSGDPKQVDTAVTDLQGLVSKTPSNGVLRLQLGKALLAQNRPDQARTHLEEAVRLRPDLVESKVLLAQIFATKQDFSRALGLTDEILSQAPRNMQARLIRTSALIGVGDRARAKAELEAIDKAFPNSSDAKFQLGYVNFMQGDLKTAAQLFAELRDKFPNDNRGLVGVVETDVAQGNYKGAIDRVEGEMRKDPNRINLRVQLASIFARSGQYDEAIKEYQFLIRKEPKSPDYELKMAETYRIKGDFNNAVEHFKKANALAPNMVLPLSRLGMMMDGVGRRSEAKQYYEQVIRLDSDNVVALNNLAFIKAEEGSDLDQAMTYAQRAKQKAPRLPDVSDTLGWIYIKKNLSDEAVRIFRDLVKEQPANPTYHYHLAMALFQKGDRPGARQECDAALKQNPSKDDQSKIKELMSKTM